MGLLRGPYLRAGIGPVLVHGAHPRPRDARDRATTKSAKLLYATLALGWRGSAKHWQRYRRAYFLLAALATALVVSVESTINFDFSYALVPGWHDTVAPPYFVAGAMFTGFAMVLILAIPIRRTFGLQKVITTNHLNNCAKLMLGLGLVVVYGHLVEFLGAYLSNDAAERTVAASRVVGPYGFAFWFSLLAFLAIQPLWSRRVRTHPGALFGISVVVLVGMWFDSFMIIVGSLSRGHLVAAWHPYAPTLWDFALYGGSFGLFFTLYFLFLRFLPIVNQSEVKELLHLRRAVSAEHA